MPGRPRPAGSGLSRSRGGVVHAIPDRSPKTIPSDAARSKHSRPPSGLRGLAGQKPLRRRPQPVAHEGVSRALDTPGQGPVAASKRPRRASGPEESILDWVGAAAGGRDPSVPLRGEGGVLPRGPGARGAPGTRERPMGRGGREASVARQWCARRLREARAARRLAAGRHDRPWGLEALGANPVIPSRNHSVTSSPPWGRGGKAAISTAPTGSRVRSRGPVSPGSRRVSSDTAPTRW